MVRGEVLGAMGGAATWLGPTDRATGPGPEAAPPLSPRAPPGYAAGVSRRRLPRVLIAVAAVVVVAVVAVVVVAGAVIRRPLPDHSGRATLPGLTAEATVLRDARGVPDIYADTPEDLFMAQGYVHAQDRFFEMDYRRHVTAGRLAELVGDNPDAIAADQVIRTFGWRRVAEQEWALLDSATRDLLDAYAAGVNAYLDTRSPETLGLEYTVLGTQVDVVDPEPWDPIDSLAWLKAMAWDLRGNYEEELGRAVAYGAVRDLEMVADLFPAYPAEHQPIVASAPTTLAAVPTSLAVPEGFAEPGLAAALDRVTAALDAVPHLLGEGEGTGSNSWVVAGEHTASGLPLLANDPHLGISQPGIWAQAGLHCRVVSTQCPYDVSGFGFAGMPGVIIGHNAHLAWGLTNLGADVTDFFLERLDEIAGTYERDGGQVPLEVRTETIKVNGGDPIELTVRSTVHGPIVSDVIDLRRALSSPISAGSRDGTAVALAWTALTPGRTMEAVFDFALARNAQDIAAAAAEFAVPTQNIVFATRDGHIGYQAPGLVPVRQAVAGVMVSADGSWPRPGWDSRYDWKGYVPAADLPAVVDPPEGFIVAANQAVSFAAPYLTSDWDYGYRSQRIRDVLEEQIAAGERINVADANALQLDVENPYARILLPFLTRLIVDDFTAEGLELLREWDGRQDTDSAAAAYFAAVWVNILELTFHDELPESEWPEGNSRSLETVRRLLEQPDNAWWDDRTTTNVIESRDEILARALTNARLEITVRLGMNPDDWSWGKVHDVAPTHPVLGGESIPGPVRTLVNAEPIPVPGGSAIVNAMGWDAAADSFTVTESPSMRMVVDLADLDRSTWVTMTGTSGHPGSAHYTDQLGPWANGETFAWPFTEAAVRAAAANELSLRP